MSFAQDDFMTLADVQDHFFTLARSKCISGRRVRRDEYIQQQLQTFMKKTQLEAAKCVQERLEVIQEHEKQIPALKAAVAKIKDEHLPIIFVEKFQKPTSDKLNREIELAQEISARRAAVTALQLRRLQLLAGMSGAGAQWLLHLRMAALVHRVLLREPIPNFFHAQLRQVIVLAPRENVADVGALLKLDAADAFQNFVPDEEAVKSFLQEMQKFNTKEQVRRKNAIALREKLQQHLATFRKIKEKSETLESSLMAELEQLERSPDQSLETTCQKLAKTCNLERSREKVKSVAAVDSLLEAVLLKRQQHSLQPTQMANILERRTQTLILEVATLRKAITKQSQSTLEKKYLAMEFAKLKDLERGKAFKKRAEKLQRKMQIALMPPSTRKFEPVKRFEKKAKRKEEERVEIMDQRALEELACFDPDVDLAWLVRNYRPTKLDIQDAANVDSLQLKWQAGKTAAND